MKCKKQDILCGNGKCIPKEKFCDGRNDCPDGVDEPKICNCASFLNVTAKHRLCDNKRDCFDKSDEDPNLCGCKSESFHCKKWVFYTFIKIINGDRESRMKSFEILDSRSRDACEKI